MTRLARLEASADDGVAMISVTGDIDLSNAGDVRSAITSSVHNDALGLVLDLRQVHYLDSAGLHLILKLRQDLRVGRQVLALVLSETSVALHTLRLAGVADDNDIFETVDAAEESVRAGAAL